MTRIAEASSALQSIAWRKVWRHLLARLRRWVPFASGVAAALLGVMLYSAVNPPTEPLTMDQVNSAVAQAIAESTPAPAYSAEAYSAIQPSLVLVVAGGADEGDTEDQCLGSGVLISDRGEILTALHLVDGADTVEVTFADGTQSSAQVASTQPENDIAVLQPEQLPETVVPAVMGNPHAVQVGDEVYAVGNPFGLYGSLSAGVISGFDREFQAEGTDQVIEGLMQIDAAVNPGNSGGPLLNRDGQVIGIVIGVLNPTEDEFFVGVGFAVPISTAAGAGGEGGAEGAEGSPQY
jgi:S1-C subfamily serine protease